MTDIDDDSASAEDLKHPFWRWRQSTFPGFRHHASPRKATRVQIRNVYSTLPVGLLLLISSAIPMCRPIRSRTFGRTVEMPLVWIRILRPPRGAGIQRINNMTATSGYTLEYEAIYSHTLSPSAILSTSVFTPTRDAREWFGSLRTRGISPNACMMRVIRVSGYGPS